MGRPRQLDEGLMRKLAKKAGKRDLVLVNKMISRKAARLGISSEAALFAGRRDMFRNRQPRVAHGSISYQGVVDTIV